MATTREHGERDFEQGQSLLLQISNALVRMQKEFFGKGPTKVKSYMFDDLLLVIMREGLTTAEKTMLEFGHPNQVRQFRQLFQDEMSERTTGLVEQLTGRRVVNYQSQVLFDPDMSLEIFVFDSAPAAAAAGATAVEFEGDPESDAGGGAGGEGAARTRAGETAPTLTRAGETALARARAGETGETGATDDRAGQPPSGEGHRPNQTATGDPA